MSEELDRAKWTLPPAKIIGVGLAVFAVILAAVAFFGRAKPVAAGSIDHVTAVQMPDSSVMVGISFNFANVMPEKPLWVRGASARLVTPDGQEFTDVAASIADFDRYFQAFPDLKQNAFEPLKPETKLAPGQSERGMIIVSFPVDKARFDQRTNLSVILDPYDQKPVVIGANQ
jgi:hypothetical protein